MKKRVLDNMLAGMPSAVTHCHRTTVTQGLEKRLSSHFYSLRDHKFVFCGLPDLFEIVAFEHFGWDFVANDAQLFSLC